MAKYCKKCGTMLDEGSGRCPNCGSEETNKGILGKKKGWFIIILSLILVVAISSIGILLTNTSTNDDGANETVIPEDYRADRIDADAYFEERATVIAITEVNRSTAPLTEAETVAILTKRGFDAYPITTEYSMDGEYSSATEISDTATDKHPIYQTYYISDTGEIWSIYVINGEVMANPVSYNLESGKDIQVLLSEKNTLTSYDSTRNMFYETAPNETEIIVKTLDRIDAQTLENIDTEAIEGL